MPDQLDPPRETRFSLGYLVSCGLITLSTLARVPSRWLQLVVLRWHTVCQYELRMTGWLKMHRAKLTARDDEIAFSLIDLKACIRHWHDDRKGMFLQDLLDRPFHGASPRKWVSSEVAPLRLTPSLINALIWKPIGSVGITWTRTSAAVNPTDVGGLQT